MSENTFQIEQDILASLERLDKPEVHSKLVNEILRNNGNAGKVIINPIVGKGLINRVYLIDDSERKLIVRINHHQHPDQQFEKEAWCLKQAQSVGIPVPNVYEAGRIDDFSYLIEDYLEGIPGEECGISKSVLWMKLGEYAAKLNGIRVSGSGGNMDLKNPGFFSGDWRGELSRAIAMALRDDYWETERIFSSQQVSSLEEVFESCRDIDSETGLCLVDIGPGNSILTGEDIDSLHLIDLEMVDAGPVPCFQFSCVAKYWGYESDIMIDFIKGYGISDRDLASIEKQIKALTVLGALGCVRWVQDRQPDEVDEYTRSAQSIALELLGDELLLE